VCTRADDDMHTKDGWD